jgi:hydroxymethylbilane synthase
LVKVRLLANYPDLDVRFVEIASLGDSLPEVSLEAEIGRGFFTSALEDALARGEADLAVHSLKDLPVEPDPRFRIAAVLEREDPRDALVSDRELADLPAGAIIGTDSSRRRAQIAALRSDLRFESVRGNLGTRIAKLDSGLYGGLILAVAGLKRLGWEGRVAEVFNETQCLPAPGQGAIAVQVVANSVHEGLAQVLDHESSAAAVRAERAVLEGVGGGCQTPIGALARVEQGSLSLVAVMAGSGLRRTTVSGPTLSARELGLQAARNLNRASGPE